MADVTLRRARPDDASRLVEIHTTARRISIPFLPNLHTGEETVRWMAEVILPTMEVWIAEATQKLPGYVTTVEIAAFLALDGEMIDQLYVAPRWQRNGIGSRLIDKARQLRNGHLRLYCFAMNAPARAFYEARGFVPIEFSDGQRNEEKLPDVLYRWVAGMA